MKTPFVSILIASHNRSRFISEAIESALSQNYHNFEVFIIDDCSFDNSWEIIQGYANVNSKIRISKNDENQGVGFTKKRLLDEAKGDILFILDADDSLTKDALSLHVKEHLRNVNVALVYSNQFMCDENLAPLNQKSISKKIPKGESHLSYHGIGHLVSVKKKFYEKIDGLNPNLRIAVDQDFYYQMEEVGDIYFINKKLYYYRQNLNSISLNKNQFKAAQQKIALMKEAKNRRLHKKLQLKNPKDTEIKLLEWYAKNELGKGNIIKASLLAIKRKKVNILLYILRYHLKYSFR